MDTLASSEFRRRYASLTRPTVVTVNGHVIGRWTPLVTASDAGEPGGSGHAGGASVPRVRSGEPYTKATQAGDGRASRGR